MLCNTDAETIAEETIADESSYLERKYALQVILYVRDHPGTTKVEVIKSKDIELRTRFLRINDMLEEGVFSVEKGNRHNAMKLHLTPKGEKMAELIDQLLKVSKE